jgi:hypothetical protein
MSVPLVLPPIAWPTSAPPAAPISAFSCVLLKSGCPHPLKPSPAATATVTKIELFFIHIPFYFILT